MTDLSSAAQSVKNDATDAYWLFHPAQVAAVLRAAADQVDHHWDGAECVDHLVALANSLEAQ